MSSLWPSVLHACFSCVACTSLLPTVLHARFSICLFSPALRTWSCCVPVRAPAWSFPFLKRSVSCVQDLQARLNANGGNLAIFGPDAVSLAASAPTLPPVPLPSPPPCRDILPADASLNAEQSVIFDDVYTLVQAYPLDTPRLVHLEAQAGAGKTFLCKHLANATRALHPDGVVCTAFTAKAARNYANGQTCHRALTLQVSEPHEEPTLKILKTGAEGAAAARTRLAHSVLIIMDEISMMRCGEFDAVWDALKVVGFRGILLAVGNDAQLGPVIQGGPANALLLHHITVSGAYNDAATVHKYLTSNVRMASDRELQRAVHDIGYGDYDDAFHEDGSQVLDLNTALFSTSLDTPEGMHAARRWTHPRMFDAIPVAPFGPGTEYSIIITATRALEQAHNEFFVRKLPGRGVMYRSRDEFAVVPGRDGSAISALSDDMGATLDDSGAPRSQLLLKPGAPFARCVRAFSIAFAGARNHPPLCMRVHSARICVRACTLPNCSRPLAARSRLSSCALAAPVPRAHRHTLPSPSPRLQGLRFSSCKQLTFSPASLKASSLPSFAVTPTASPFVC